MVTVDLTQLIDDRFDEVEIALREVLTQVLIQIRQKAHVALEDLEDLEDPTKTNYLRFTSVQELLRRIEIARDLGERALNSIKNEYAFNFSVDHPKAFTADELNSFTTDELESMHLLLRDADLPLDKFREIVESLKTRLKLLQTRIGTESNTSQSLVSKFLREKPTGRFNQSHQLLKIWARRLVQALLMTKKAN